MLRSLRVLLCVTILAGIASAQTTLNGAGATFPNPIYRSGLTNTTTHTQTLRSITSPSAAAAAFAR